MKLYDVIIVDMKSRSVSLHSIFNNLAEARATFREKSKELVDACNTCVTISWHKSSYEFKIVDKKSGDLLYIGSMNEQDFDIAEPYWINEVMFNAKEYCEVELDDDDAEAIANDVLYSSDNLWSNINDYISSLIKDKTL